MMAGPGRAALLAVAWWMSWPLLAVAESDLPTAPVVPASLLEEPLVPGNGNLAEVGLPAQSPEVARRLLDQGQPLVALYLADQALTQGRSSPERPLWQALKAEALLATGEHALARPLLDNLPEGPLAEHPEWMILQGDLFMAEKRPAEAKERYARFLTSHPAHPRRFLAQRGLGLCALDLGLLEEADLHLSLYAAEPARPRPDVTLVDGLARLALRKGLLDDAARHVQRLTALQPRHPQLKELTRQLATALTEGGRLEEAVTWWQRVLDDDRLAHAAERETRVYLAGLLRQLHRWQEAAAQLEEAMAGKGGDKFLPLHSDLTKQWLAAPATALPPEVACSPALERAGERGQVLRALLTALTRQELFEAEGLLARVLDDERRQRLGLLAPGGLLRPEVLNPQPLSEGMRLLYADAFRALGYRQEAWFMLKELTGGEAAGLRGVLIAAETPVDQAAFIQWVEGHLPSGAESLDADLAKRAAQAMFLLRERGEVAKAQLIWERLTRVRSVPVERAVRFLQAVRWEEEGKLAPALVSFLDLATDGGGSELLPEPAQAAAARVLIALGRKHEADLLLTPPSLPGAEGDVPAVSGAVSP